MTRRTLVNGVLIALGAASSASCSDNQTVVSNALNLNRPVDVAFACYGAMKKPDGTVVASPQPTSSCDFRSTERPTTAATPAPIGQDGLTITTVDTTKIPLTAWFGFILQSASGTIAVAYWQTMPASTFTGSATGNAEVAVLDADPLTPGKNAISVGDNPIGLETDKTGCFVVTANAGSCDLSVLDVNTAAQAALSSVGVGTEAQVHVSRLSVVGPDGKTPLFSRPAAIVGEPSLALRTTAPAIEACPANPTGLAYVAYPGCHIVAGIDMSAGTQGMVKSVIQFDAAGKPTLITDATAINTAIAACPVECTDVSAPLSPLPAKGTPVPLRPTTLAYEYDPAAGTRSLAIGADNSPIVTIATLQNDPDDTKQMLPTSFAQVPLAIPAGGQLGVLSLAMSPKIAMGGDASGTFPPVDTGTPGGFGQYVYAVTTDGTVRVIDVLGTNNPTPGVPNECDTQIDPRAIEATPSVASNAQLLQCIPIGYQPAGSPTPLPRRGAARSAGIELPGHAVPLSVAIVHPPIEYTTDASGAPVLTRPTTAPNTLIGTFAIITSTAGPTYIVNVDDDNNAAGTDTYDATRPQLTEPSLIMAHQLRDGVSARDTPAQTTSTDAAGNALPPVPACNDLGTPLVGGPRANVLPVTDATVGGIPASKVGELPSFRQVKCTAPDVGAGGIAVSELALAADAKTRSLVFPDLKSLSLEENWTAVWEGTLSLDGANGTPTVINGPIVRQGNFVTVNVDGAKLDEPSNPFCAMGVEPYDIVQLLGCNPANGDLDCPANYKCYVHADTQVQIEGVAAGSCMLATEADRLAAACRDYLISQRRYTVRTATTGELQLMPRLHELDATPLDGCTDDNQCQALATAEVRLRVDQFDPNTSIDTHKWSCMVDPRRAPLAGDPAKKRCVQTCTVHRDPDRDKDCDVGSLCIGDAVDGPGVCTEGVIPPQSCMNAPQRFEVRGHEAFVVIGDHTGYEHPIIAATGKVGDACVVNPNADPRRVSRIPLSAPACTATNPITGEVTPGKLEPNPCSTTTDTTDTEISYPAGSCTGGTQTLTTRTNVPAIRLRKNGLTLTMVDPVYPGDARCPLDRGGAAGVGTAFPLTFPGLNILGKTHITAGSDPLTLSGAGASLFTPTLPVKVVAGPTGSIWVLDDGDFLSQTIDQSSTLGAVFRVESIDLGVVNLLQ